MNLDYIIVQAGGKGKRLQQLTANKPKALAPVNNLPIIFNLFRKFSDKKFIIIGDYKYEVLREYLAVFADVEHITLKASGTGTCCGIAKSISYIPHSASFMVIWSDLLLCESFSLSELENNQNYIGISKDTECRWSYNDSCFIEAPSTEHGVAGLFIFKDRDQLKNVPEQGEFVKWLQTTDIVFRELELRGMLEIGTIEAYKKNENPNCRCRPFNKLLFDETAVIKVPLDDRGCRLADMEFGWYQKAIEVGFTKIPEIISTNPLTMQRINGKNISELDISLAEKEKLLFRIMDSLYELHSTATVSADVFSVLECYFTKTMNRLKSVRDLIPFAKKEFIQINGRCCKNVFFYQKELYEKTVELLFCNEFGFIHGDCTFSNIMTEADGSIVFIDPRGYFGFTKIYGDIHYDWAKLYYSVFGNYDQFNKRNFKLVIDKNDISLEIKSNGWEALRYCFLDFKYGIDIKKIQLIHALIWLSLTTYAWEDYDSICGAFYNGLYYLEEII